MSQSSSAQFSVHLSRQTGSLERLISRIRRRGFLVENMMVSPHGINNEYRIELSLSGTRSFETLMRHLANLVEVSAVSLRISNACVEYSAMPRPELLERPLPCPN